LWKKKTVPPVFAGAFSFKGRVSGESRCTAFLCTPRPSREETRMSVLPVVERSGRTYLGRANKGDPLTKNRQKNLFVPTKRTLNMKNKKRLKPVGLHVWNNWERGLGGGPRLSTSRVRPRGVSHCLAAQGRLEGEVMSSLFHSPFWARSRAQIHRFRLGLGTDKAVRPLVAKARHAPGGRKQRHAGST